MSAARFDFGRGPLPDLNVLRSALAVLPESERYAFAEAIGARASAWRSTSAGSAPAPWPAVVRVEADPSLAAGADRRPRADGDEGDAW